MLTGMKNTSHSRLFLSGALALTFMLGACGNNSGASEPVADTAVETETTVSATDDFEAIVDGTEESRVVALAQSFDRQLTSMASFGTESDMSDVDPRRVQLLIDMLGDPSGVMSDVPDARTDTALLERSQLRVLVWQGAGAASVKWTRLFQGMPADSSMLLSGVGENGKLFNPEVRQEVCIQFHADGKDAWLRLSSQANQQGVVSNVLEEACPGSSFPGIVPATGTTYANLAVGPTVAVTDPTW